MALRAAKQKDELDKTLKCLHYWDMGFPTPPLDRADLMREVGELLYGREWRTPLAAAVGVASKSITRWSQREYEVPGWVIEKLPGLVRREAFISVARAAELGDYASSLEQTVSGDMS